MATTETILVLAEEIRAQKFPHMNLEHIPAFYNKENYIDALSNSIANYLKDKKWDKLMFSYHGVPERHIRKSDITKSHCKPEDQNFKCCMSDSPAHEFCYKHQCYMTTHAVVKKLGLSDDQYFTTFQSRLGNDPWLQPYTDKTIEKFAEEGVENLAVVTPAFVSDCLETLEEIAMVTDRAKNKAEWYAERLTKYLLSNETLYPKYITQENPNIDTIYPKRTNYTSGMYLGGVGGACCEGEKNFKGLTVDRGRREYCNYC